MSVNCYSNTEDMPFKFYGAYILFCPTLAKGSKWHTIQIWVIDVFIIHIMSSSSRPIFMQKHSSYYEMCKIRHPDIHWRQCKWQTHFALLREISLLSLASFCQIRAVLYTTCTCEHFSISQTSGVMSQNIGGGTIFAMGTKRPSPRERSDRAGGGGVRVSPLPR